MRMITAASRASATAGDTRSHRCSPVSRSSGLDMVIRVPYPYPEWQQTVIYGVGRSRLGEGGRLKDNTGKRQGPSEGLERSLFDFSGLRIRRRFLLSSMGVGCSGGNLTDQLDDRASSRGTRVVCEPRRGDDPLKGSTGSATTATSPSSAASSAASTSRTTRSPARPRPPATASSTASAPPRSTCR